MQRKHSRKVTLVALIAAAMSGCSLASTASTTPSPTGAPTATPPPTSTPAPTVRSLLTAFGPGQITTYHMPIAEPSWLARVNPRGDFNAQFDDSVRNLVALVDEAAREGDTTSLLSMCFECQNDAALKAQVAQALGTPGALGQLSLLIESTHFIGQNGYTYPSFALTPDQPDAIMTADAKALGAISPTAYLKSGMVTLFPRYAGPPTDPNVDGSTHWGGVKLGVELPTGQ